MKFNKVLKNSLLGLLAIFLLSAIGGYFYVQKLLTPPPNVCHVSDGADTIPIHWLGNDFSDRAGMFVPIQLENVPDTFYLQVDLGAVQSVMYGRSLQSVIDKYHLVLDNSKWVKSLAFELGNLHVKYDSIPAPDYGEDFLCEPDEFKIVGTLGADFFMHKKVVISFSNSFIKLSDDIIYNNNQLTDIDVVFRWIQIPVEIEGETVTMMWDTGASPFSLITSKSTWEEMVIDPNNKLMNEMNSMGKTIQIYRGETSKSISIAGKQVKLKEVTYTEGFGKTIQFMMWASGMRGMIGNEVFRNENVFLDLKGKKIGIL